MNLSFKIAFQLTRICRMCWYNFYYRINKWKLIEGVYLPVYLNYGYSVLRFIDDGTYECEELHILKSRLTSTDTVLELGTGMGFIATFCAKIIDPKRVYTYEANPYMEPIITEVFKRNCVTPNFEIALLGNKELDNKFVVKKDFLASSQKKGSINGKEVTVPFLDLNNTIQKFSPNYLVMDIEGNEWEVFSIIDFQSINKIQFELHPTLLSQAEIDFIFNKLRQFNFVKDEAVSTEKNYFFSRV